MSQKLQTNEPTKSLNKLSRSYIVLALTILILILLQGVVGLPHTSYEQQKEMPIIRQTLNIGKWEGEGKRIFYDVVSKVVCIYKLINYLYVFSLLEE